MNSNEVITSQGIVEVVLQNEKNDLWSFKVGEDWVGAGKYEPKFSQGDEIKYGYTKNGKWSNLEFGTVEILEKGAAKATTPSKSSSKAVDWDGKDKRITYLACRNSALQLVSMAVTSDSIILPTKQADRLEVLKGYVDDLCDEYYHDVYGESYKGDTGDFS